MNDFTKDELKELWYAMDCCHVMPFGAPKPPLMIKIGSMIDNYCECKIIKTMKDIDGTEIVDYCANCGKQI